MGFSRRGPNDWNAKLSVLLCGSHIPWMIVPASRAEAFLMRLIPVILLLSLACLAALAQEDVRQSQVSAATADALESLQRDVLATPISLNFTVRDLIERTHSQDALSNALL